MEDGHPVAQERRGKHRIEHEHVQRVHLVRVAAPAGAQFIEGAVQSFGSGPAAGVRARSHGPTTATKAQQAHHRHAILLS